MLFSALCKREEEGKELREESGCVVMSLKELRRVDRDGREWRVMEQVRRREKKQKFPRLTRLDP